MIQLIPFFVSFLWVLDIYVEYPFASAITSSLPPIYCHHVLGQITTPPQKKHVNLSCVVDHREYVVCHLYHNHVGKRNLELSFNGHSAQKRSHSLNGASSNNDV